MNEAPADASLDPERAARRALRRRLLAERGAFVASPAVAGASAALAAALVAVVVELEPACLGLYCAFGSEFNAAAAFAADPRCADLSLALPYARRVPKALEFRRWDGAAPLLLDECGIGSCAGAVVVPDVVVVPCVGFSEAGHRLGYGGGYYDRWLAAHRQVTAVGLAWSFAALDLATFAARPHDIPLAVIVTETGVR
ncbi:MAG: 5-formyltetrahydrofolate cyclo-ligase [Caldimonas sp.]